jgi:pyruvate dehydrogenase E1 component alpha subunit
MKQEKKVWYAPNKFESYGEEEIKAVVEESVKFAEESAKPEAHEIYEDVYSDPYPYVKD